MNALPTGGFINRMKSKIPGDSRHYNLCYHLATKAD
jgi:hypothetical protein